MSVRPDLQRPLRNRVTPFGDIVAHPARGTLMGNRGCLHDEHGAIVRSSASKAWITCLPKWRGINRALLSPHRYTELFFLDEVTALAAGHRPCGECRPDQLKAFKHAWARAFQLHHLPLVAEIDDVLPDARASGKEIDVDRLPDGSMIALDSQAFFQWNGKLRPWSFQGYGRAIELDQPGALTLLTPAPIVAVLVAGYRPIVHPTADKVASDAR